MTVPVNGNTITCYYCGQTVPPSTVFYVLQKLGNAGLVTYYCETDYESHSPADLQSGLDSFGGVTIKKALTPEA